MGDISQKEQLSQTEDDLKSILNQIQSGKLKPF